MAAFVRMSTSIALLASLASCASATPVVEKEKTIRIEARDGGWKFDELCAHVHDVAGVSVIFDSGSTFKFARVFVGPYELRDDELFPWLQAIAADRRMTLVPFDGPSAVRRRQWFAMNQDVGPAVFVNESDVASYEARAALRMATWLRSTIVDATFARNWLVERSPELERCQTLGSAKGLLVSGPAPAVAAAQRELYRLEAEARPADAPPAPPIDRSEP